MQSRRSGSSGSRLPAIAPRQDTGPSLGSQAALGDVPSETRRNRLPPRSRSGCWTCRSRKVKCDERRPACGQCVRLGHECDYNARISFKDDTPRILERMQETSVVGDNIWGCGHIVQSHNGRQLTVPATPSNQGLRPTRSVEDLLPPFQTLTNDEEREKKAELHQPGTYLVIANPRSFESLPEYRLDTLPGTGRTQPLWSSELSSQSSLRSHNSSENEDPNTVILSNFEDTSRRGSMQTPHRLLARSPSQLPASSTRDSRDRDSQQQRRHSWGPPRTSLSLHTEHNDGGSSNALEHYRKFVSPKILKRGFTSSLEDMFECQARTYPPLLHAIMALSRLTEAHLRGHHTADALEHYHQVIPALQKEVQSAQDSYSDGAFFTHYLLYLYEIAAALQGDSNMWQHHSNQLLKIIVLRRQANGVEPYEFIVWIISCIDIYALLSMSSTGVFTQGLISESVFPTPEKCLRPATVTLAGASHIMDQAPASSASGLHHEAMLLMFQIGQQARDLRTEAYQRRFEYSETNVATPTFLETRIARVKDVHGTIFQTNSDWNIRYSRLWPNYNKAELPSLHTSFCWQQAHLLFNACVIYSRTSMYPGQLENVSEDDEQQIRDSIRNIIDLVRAILSEIIYEIRIVVLPLFLAGFAAEDTKDKTIVLELILAVEQHEYRGSMANVIGLLEQIYGKQRSAIATTGNANSVDWIEEVKLSGQGFVI